MLLDNSKGYAESFCLIRVILLRLSVGVVFGNPFLK